MEKSKIRMDPGKCTQCYCCQLICSFIHGRSFNPEEAGIVIGLQKGISFSDQCRKNCSACVNYCPTGALSTIR
jgi:Fe-S-cluster-containing hydrogenase component 2